MILTITQGFAQHLTPETWHINGHIMGERLYVCLGKAVPNIEESGQTVEGKDESENRLVDLVTAS